MVYDPWSNTNTIVDKFKAASISSKITMIICYTLLFAIAVYICYALVHESIYIVNLENGI